VTTHEVEKDDELEYDLGNLAAFDYEPIDANAYAQKKTDTLIEVARDNVQLLFNKIFDLETAAADIGRLAHLPRPSFTLPREKPLPKAKEETKWEAFAKLKGIKKKKRGRMEFSEIEDKWMPRYGYGKANDESRQWILPAAEGELPSTDDPWAVRFTRSSIHHSL
jgi:regulator of ribosome biosynthesis